MADDASSSYSSERRGGPGRGGRGGAPRGEGGRGEASRGDAGGFRIRLSDNELQAARTLQEAFGLRSTVAVLGFSLRSLAQMLEQGQLEELISQQRAQAGSRGAAPARGDERRGGRPESGSGAARIKADPFARPSRPAAAPVEEPIEEPAAAAEEDVAEESAVAEAAVGEAAFGEAAFGEAAFGEESLDAAAPEPADDATGADLPVESAEPVTAAAADPTPVEATSSSQA